MTCLQIFELNQHKFNLSGMIWVKKTFIFSFTFNNMSNPSIAPLRSWPLDRSVTRRWQQASESHLTNQIHPIHFRRWLAARRLKVKVCLSLPPHVWERSDPISPWLSVIRFTSRWKRAAETAHFQPLGSRRFSLGYTNVTRPWGADDDPDLNNH